jgi:hypothetical protein
MLAGHGESRSASFYSVQYVVSLTNRADNRDNFHGFRLFLFCMGANNQQITNFQLKLINQSISSDKCGKYWLKMSTMYAFFLKIWLFLVLPEIKDLIN